jgi:hypothetical protein
MKTVNANTYGLSDQAEETIAQIAYDDSSSFNQLINDSVVLVLGDRVKVLEPEQFDDITKIAYEKLGYKRVVLT